MIFPKEIQQLHKNITEYLKFGKFENTYECFDHEIRTKIVSQKLLNSKLDLADDSTPELFRIMKGVSKEQTKFKKERDELSSMSDQYLDLLTGSRQIFGICVKLLDMIEKENSVKET